MAGANRTRQRTVAPSPASRSALRRVNEECEDQQSTVKPRALVLDGWLKSGKISKESRKADDGQESKTHGNETASGAEQAVASVGARVESAVKVPSRAESDAVHGQQSLQCSGDVNSSVVSGAQRGAGGSGNELSRKTNALEVAGGRAARTAGSSARKSGVRSSVAKTQERPVKRKRAAESEIASPVPVPVVVAQGVSPQLREASAPVSGEAHANNSASQCDDSDTESEADSSHDMQEEGGAACADRSQANESPGRAPGKDEPQPSPVAESGSVAPAPGADAKREGEAPTPVQPSRLDTLRAAIASTYSVTERSAGFEKRHDIVELREKIRSMGGVRGPDGALHVEAKQLTALLVHDRGETLTELAALLKDSLCPGMQVAESDVTSLISSSARFHRYGGKGVDVPLLRWRAEGSLLPDDAATIASKLHRARLARYRKLSALIFLANLLDSEEAPATDDIAQAEDKLRVAEMSDLRESDRYAAALEGNQPSGSRGHSSPENETSSATKTLPGASGDGSGSAAEPSKAAEKEQQRKEREAEKARREAEKEQQRKEREAEKERQRKEREAEKARREAEKEQQRKEREAEKARREAEKEQQRKEREAEKARREAEKEQQRKEREAEKARREAEKEQQRKQRAHKAEKAKEEARERNFSFFQKMGVVKEEIPEQDAAAAARPLVDAGDRVNTDAATACGRFSLWQAPVGAKVAPVRRSLTSSSVPHGDCGNIDVMAEFESFAQRARSHRRRRVPRDELDHPMKLLQFHDNLRPAYYGFSVAYVDGSMRAPGPRARNPFGKAGGLDYDYESGLDWEEEDPDAESLGGDSDDDADAASQGAGSDVDSFVVDDGYLSADEGLSCASDDEGAGPVRLRRRHGLAAAAGAPESFVVGPYISSLVHGGLESDEVASHTAGALAEFSVQRILDPSTAEELLYDADIDGDGRDDEEGNGQEGGDATSRRDSKRNPTTAELVEMLTRLYGSSEKIEDVLENFHAEYPRLRKRSLQEAAKKYSQRLFSTGLRWGTWAPTEEAISDLGISESLRVRPGKYSIADEMASELAKFVHGSAMSKEEVVAAFLAEHKDLAQRAVEKCMREMECSREHGTDGNRVWIVRKPSSDAGPLRDIALAVPRAQRKRQRENGDKANAELPTQRNKKGKAQSMVESSALAAAFRGAGSLGCASHAAMRDAGASTSRANGAAAENDDSARATVPSGTGVLAVESMLREGALSRAEECRSALQELFAGESLSAAVQSCPASLLVLLRAVLSNPDVHGSLRAMCSRTLADVLDVIDSGAPTAHGLSISLVAGDDEFRSTLVELASSESGPLLTRAVLRLIVCIMGSSSSPLCQDGMIKVCVEKNMARNAGSLLKEGNASTCGYVLAMLYHMVSHAKHSGKVIAQLGSETALARVASVLQKQTAVGCRKYGLLILEAIANAARGESDTANQANLALEGSAAQIFEALLACAMDNRGKVLANLVQALQALVGHVSTIASALREGSSSGSAAGPEARALVDALRLLARRRPEVQSVLALIA